MGYLTLLEWINNHLLCIVLSTGNVSFILTFLAWGFSVGWVVGTIQGFKYCDSPSIGIFKDDFALNDSILKFNSEMLSLF